MFLTCMYNVFPCALIQGYVSVLFLKSAYSQGNNYDFKQLLIKYLLDSG